jgi:hypothetical protein
VSYGILTYPSYFDPPIHGILTSPTHDIMIPPTHGILIPLPMVYWTPYPWYFYPPTHGIFIPLPMVYQTLSYGIMNPSLLVEIRGVNLPWSGSKYNDEKFTPGTKYHMVFWPRDQYIIWKLTLGSIYHGGQNTISHREIMLISANPC